MKMHNLTWPLKKHAVVLEPPVSKADAIRALFLQHARGEKLMEFKSALPDDVADAITALNFLSAGGGRLTLGLGAAPFRFAVALAALTPGLSCSIDVAQPLRRRPVAPLLESLTAALGPLGLIIEAGAWPLRIDTRRLLLPERVAFSVEPGSSQFLSALALAAADAVAEGRCERIDIQISHPPAGAPYADLTRRWIESAGFQVESGDAGWAVSGFRRAPWTPELPLDWSAIAYLLIWAWRCGCAVRTGDPAGHPDAVVLDILEDAGLRCDFDGDSVSIGGELSGALPADARRCPDLVPTLGILALAATGESRFAGVRHLRGKESDRLQFLLDVAASAGAVAQLRGDELRILPAKGRREEVLIETKEDHRRAMAGSLLVALGWPGVKLDQPECVGKSFPGYWGEIEKCGARLVALR